MKLRLLIIGLLASALVACGGTSSESDGATGASGDGRTVEMTLLDEMKFVPATIEVEAGQTVTVNLTNKGVLVHDFIVEGLAQEVQAVVQPGKQETVTFTAPAGEYAYACKQPGHEEAGMKGVIRVK